MTDAEILGAIAAAESQALGGNSSAVQTDRADAIDRYYGKPYGDELPGRSSVVSRDVADVLEGVTANVVKPFVGGDQVVQFDPQGPEDEAAAEQETDYVNFIALERNNGFVWLVSAIKDTLLQRVGYVKVAWERREDVVTEVYEGKSVEEVMMLEEDKGVEIIEATPIPTDMLDEQGQPVTLFDIKVKRTKPTEFCKIYPVPPDEALVSHRARVPSLQECDFFQHRTRKSLSELREAGYKVDDDISDDDSGDTIEDLARSRFNTQGDWDDATGNAARRLVLFKESYLRIDRDGDGVAELRRVCSVGANILADDDCDIIPFAAFSAVLVPHQHLGMSVYDLVQDVARIKTALMRSYLDNRSLQNNGRYAINADAVNLDDFLVSRPGGVVRVNGDPSANILPLVAPDTSTGALQGLEYLDSVREQRTGYTRNSAGIDNNALTNRTMGGMAMQLSQSQLRLEMIARTIAETGARDVFRIIHALTLKHSTREEKVRLKGKWVAVDPREWVRRTDLSIAIGLGTGTPEQQLAKLMGLAPILQTLQPLGLVGVEQAYNFAAEAFKLSGYKAPDRFLKPPQVDPQTGQPKEPPPPIPPEIQAKQMEIQAKGQELQAKTQADAQKFQAEAQLKQQEMAMQIQVKEREQQAQLAVQAANDQRQAELDERKAQLDIVKMEMEDKRERERMILEAQLKREEMQMTHERETAALQVQAHMQDRDIRTKEQGMAYKGEEVAANREQKKPVRAYNVKRGPDGRAASLEVVR